MRRRAPRPRTRRAAPRARTLSTACGSRSGSASRRSGGRPSSRRTRSTPRRRRPQRREESARARRSPPARPARRSGCSGCRPTRGRRPGARRRRSHLRCRWRSRRAGRSAAERTRAGPARGTSAPRGRSAGRRPHRVRSGPARPPRRQRPPLAARGTSPRDTRSAARSSRRAAPAALRAGAACSRRSGSPEPGAARAVPRFPRQSRPRRKARTQSGSGPDAQHRTATASACRGRFSELREGLDRSAHGREAVPRGTDELNRPEERLQAQAAGASGQAASRKNVVRAGCVVAQDGRRAEEDGARVADIPGERRPGRRPAARGVPGASSFARATASAREPTVSIRALPFVRATHLVGDAAARGEEDRRAVRAVLGLGEEVGGALAAGSAVSSAITTTSLGPAGRSIATSPATSSFACVTKRFPGPTIFATLGIVSVP